MAGLYCWSYQGKNFMLRDEVMHTATGCCLKGDFSVGEKWLCNLIHTCSHIPSSSVDHFAMYVQKLHGIAVFISAFLKSRQVFTRARSKSKLCSLPLITGRDVKGNLPKKKASKEWKKRKF